MFFRKKNFLFALMSAACMLFFSAFSSKEGINFKWMQECLKTRFNPSHANVKLKKWELNITEDGFFRLRKVYPNGKQEYFSFNVKRFNDLNYLGTTVQGEIIINTKSDDIIVQTYNDPKGNIDSMTSSLKLPLINVEPEMLDSLINDLRNARLK